MCAWVVGGAEGGIAEDVTHVSVVDDVSSSTGNQLRDSNSCGVSTFGRERW